MRDLQTLRTQYRVADFVAWQRDGALELNPNFQRRPVWKKGAKSYLIDTILRGLFLRVVTSFEGFLENLFISILEKRTRYKPGRVALKMQTSSRNELMDILLQGEKYMTWLPFYNTENRAKLYLRDGKPFTELDNGDKSTIKTITTIRNAIAHKSPHAIREFQRTVIGSQPLLRGERSPAGFLRSQTRSGTDVRFQVYMGELGKMALALC